MTHLGDVLVVVAHPDDEALGCGGAMALWSTQGRSVHVLILADGESSRLPNATSSPSIIATRHEAAESANRILGSTSVESLTLPDNRMDEVGLLTIVKQIEAHITRIRPTTLVTHHSGDVNIDHRITHDACIAACRPIPNYPVKELLFFEVPSSTEWRPPSSGPIFAPNYFIDISSSLDKKMSALHAYASEMRPFPHPRSLMAVEALARWRGATVGVEAAEAFELGRLLISPQ